MENTGTTKVAHWCSMLVGIGGEAFKDKAMTAALAKGEHGENITEEEGGDLFVEEIALF
jgi:hypothetical protein